MNITVNFHVIVPQSVLTKIDGIAADVKHVKSVVDELLARSKTIVGIDVAPDKPVDRPNP